MAITQEEILQLTVSMFNASLGANYLADIESANFATTADLAAYYGTLTQFTSQFDGMTDAEQVTAMLSNFGLDSTNTAAFDYFTAQVAAGVSNAVTLQAADAYLATQTAEVLATYSLTDAAATLVNKTAAATYYSVTQGLSATTVDDLKATVSTITEDVATVATANAAVDTAVASTTTAAALATLADANTALSDALEVLDADTSYVMGGDAEVEAPDATAANIASALASVAGKVATDTGIAAFADKSDAVQDAYIAAHKGSLSADVDTATAEVSASTNSLITTMETKQASLVELLEADTAANATLTAEIAAFDSANGTTSVAFVAYATTTKEVPTANEIVVMTEAKYSATADYSNGYILVNGIVYVGQASVAFADLVAADRSTEISSAYSANETAEAAVVAGEASLVATVKEIILAENEAYSVATADDALTASDATIIPTTSVVNILTKAGSEEVTVDLDVSVDVFETEAKEDIATGDKTVTLSGTASADTPITVTITDVDGTATVVATVANTDAAADATIAASVTNVDAAQSYTATISAGVITVSSVDGLPFTVAATGDATGVTSADQTVQDTALAVDAADLTEDLQDAINDQSDFDTVAADFVAARETEAAINALETAVTDATEAITNDADAVEDAGLGLNLITIDGTDAATADADMFLFNDVASTFSGVFASDDAIFVGADYTLVTAASDEDITDSLGDVSTLEIIAVDNGTDTVLYFEEETFAGNGSSATDTIAVTLSGVTDSTVSIDASGFLSIA